MVQFLSIFFLGILQFLLGFSKVPVFCVILYIELFQANLISYLYTIHNHIYALLLQIACLC